MLVKHILTPILDMQVIPDPPTLTRPFLHAYSYTPAEIYCGYASHARPVGARSAPIGCKRLGAAGGSHLLVQRHKY